MNLRTGPAGRRSIQRLLAAASLAFICARPALSDEAWARIQGKIVAVDGATLLVRLKERSLEGKILRQRYGETVEARLKDSVVITFPIRTARSRLSKCIYTRQLRRGLTVVL